MNVNLMLGDCLERMAEIEPGSVDLIAADLPYGTTACKWDAVIPFEPLWAAFKRVLKARGAVVLTSSQPFTSALVMSNPKWFKYEWIWEKTTGTGFLDANRKPLKFHESICVFSESQTTYHPQKFRGPPNHSKGRSVGGSRPNDIYGTYEVRESDISGLKYPRSIIKFEKHPARESRHPSEKPVALFEYLIRTYSNEGEIVLDCTMGSGTTGVACVSTGRNFIGIERDPGYFAVAERRINEARSALPLFAEVAS